jgi:hypothetical protein
MAALPSADEQGTFTSALPDQEPMADACYSPGVQIDEVPTIGGL